MNVLLFRAHPFWRVNFAQSAQLLEKWQLLTRFSNLVNPSLTRTLKVTNPSHSKEEPTKILLHCVSLEADCSLECRIAGFVLQGNLLREGKITALVIVAIAK